MVVSPDDEGEGGGRGLNSPAENGMGEEGTAKGPTLSVSDRALEGLPSIIWPAS